MKYLIRPFWGGLDIYTPGGDRLWRLEEDFLSVSLTNFKFHLTDATGRRHGTVFLRGEDYAFSIKPQADGPDAAFSRTDGDGYIRVAGTPRISVFFDANASVGKRAFQFTLGSDKAGSLEESRSGPWILSISQPSGASVLLLLACGIVESLYRHGGGSCA